MLIAKLRGDRQRLSCIALAWYHGHTLAHWRPPVHTDMGWTLVVYSAESSPTVQHTLLPMRDPSFTRLCTHADRLIAFAVGSLSPIVLLSLCAQQEAVQDIRGRLGIYGSESVRGGASCAALAPSAAALAPTTDTRWAPPVGAAVYTRVTGPSFQGRGASGHAPVLVAKGSMVKIPKKEERVAGEDAAAVAGPMADADRAPSLNAEKLVPLSGMDGASASGLGHSSEGEDLSSKSNTLNALSGCQKAVGGDDDGAKRQGIDSAPNIRKFVKAARRLPSVGRAARPLASSSQGLSVSAFGAEGSVRAEQERRKGHSVWLRQACAGAGTGREESLYGKRRACEEAVREENGEERGRIKRKRLDGQGRVGHLSVPTVAPEPISVPPRHASATGSHTTTEATAAAAGGTLSRTPARATTNPPAEFPRFESGMLTPAPYLVSAVSKLRNRPSMSSASGIGILYNNDNDNDNSGRGRCGGEFIRPRQAARSQELYGAGNGGHLAEYLANLDDRDSPSHQVSVDNAGVAVHGATVWHKVSPKARSPMDVDEGEEEKEDRCYELFSHEQQQEQERSGRGIGTMGKGGKLHVDATVR